MKKCKERISLGGFLECSRRGGKITASAPKGNGGVCYYYHCKTKCGERFRTDVAHEALLTELGKITIKQSYVDLFEQILKDHYQRNLKEDKAAVNTLDTEIDKNQKRISSAQQLCSMVNWMLLITDKLSQGMNLKLQDFNGEKRNYQPLTQIYSSM